MRCKNPDCDSTTLTAGRGWCRTCYSRWQRHGDPSPRAPETVEARFWRQVDRRGPDKCWPWLSPLNPSGYGQFWVNDLGRSVAPHRFAYESEIGPISESLTLDHICHTRDSDCPGGPTCPHRACCNPAHLEPATRGENAARGQRRKTHCPQNHEYTEENTYLNPGGWRSCLTCQRESQKRTDAKRKEARRLAREQRS